MTPEQRQSAEELAGIISAQASRGEAKIKSVIKHYNQAVALADELAGDDRNGSDAKAALELRQIMEGYKGALAAMKAAHSAASIFQCEYLDVPMTRGGER